VLVPESRDPAEKPLDVAGALLSIAGLGSLLFAIIEAPSNGWTSPTTLSLFVVAALLLVGFVVWEATRERPLIDLALFRKPTFTGAALSIGLVFFALFASIFFLTQYLQVVLGYSALAAGIRMTPVAVGLILGTVLSTRSRPLAGTRILVATGLAITAGGLAILASVSTTSDYGTVLASLFVAGFGMGLTSAPATNSIMSSVPREQAGVASAINNVTRPVGGALGVAVLGSLLSTAYRSSMEGPTSGLPDATAEAAQDSIGTAAQVAARLGGPEGETLLLAAQSSFVDSMSTAILVGVGVALLGAAVAATVLPSRRHEFAAGARSPHGPPQSEASHAHQSR
jgi:Na+/melibiose symporter-like transporter